MKKLSLVIAIVMLAGILSVIPAMAEVADPLTVADDGYRIDGDGWYSVNTLCKNGTDDIFGRIYYPADFDEARQYAAVLLVHGAALNADFWHGAYAPELAKAGCVCYAFDERAGTGADAVSNASAALDFLMALDCVNKDSIYLFGNGEGGVAAQVLASQRGGEIAGVIALYGGIVGADSDAIPGLDEALAHPYDSGEVLVIWGSDDADYSLNTALENVALYPEATLVVVSDAVQGFGDECNRPAVISAQQVVDFIDRTANGIPNEKKKTSKATDDDLWASDEGYTYTGDGYNWTVHYAVKDDVAIFGRMYYPADFDEGRRYPIVIMAHGNLGTADVWDKVIAPRVAQMGECLVYSIDARSETDSGRGSYSTPLEGVEINRNTVNDYANDLDQVIDFVKTLDYVDAGGIYLMGGSKGGMTVQLAASRRSEDIRGIIVQSGAVGDDTSALMVGYDEMKANPYSGGEALFVQGIEDKSCLISRGEANMLWYHPGTLVAISGAGHGLGFQNDRASEIFVDSMNEFIHRTYNHIGE